MSREIAVLCDIRDTLLQLQKVSKEERQAVINNDARLLEQACRQKEKLEKDLIRLEEKRLALIKERTASELAAKAGGNAGKLQLLAAEIKNLLREVHALQTTNKLLIQSELALWEQVKAILFPQHVSYTAAGKTAGKQTAQVITRLA